MIIIQSGVKFKLNPNPKPVAASSPVDTDADPTSVEKVLIEDTEGCLSGYEVPLTDYAKRDKINATRRLKHAHPDWVDDEAKKAEVLRANAEAKPRRDRQRRKETGRRGKQTQSHKDKIKASKAVNRLNKPNKHGTTNKVPPKSTYAIKHGTASLEEIDDKNGEPGIYYTWVDDAGNHRQRKRRSDKGKKRGRNKRTKGAGGMRVRTVTSQGMLAAHDEVIRLNHLHDLRMIKQEPRDECRAAWFRFHDITDDGRKLPRSIYYRWRTFFEATRWRPDFDMCCPVCKVKQPYGSRCSWVIRVVECRVTCKTCHLALKRFGPETRYRPIMRLKGFPHDKAVVIEAFKRKAEEVQAQLSRRPILENIDVEPEGSLNDIRTVDRDARG